MEEHHYFFIEERGDTPHNLGFICFHTAVISLKQNVVLQFPLALIMLVWYLSVEPRVP
jgi:hypothetical protein